MIDRARNRVLIVEDDLQTLRPIATYLSRNGYEVRTARSGGQAVDVGRDFSPDVLLSDVVLQDEVDGLTVARKLIKRDPDVRLVFLTSYPEEDIRAQGRDLKIRAALTKPSSLQQILGSIEEALEA